ncbi:Gustatory receptor 33, partial [Frankliniella occidentalis]
MKKHSSLLPDLFGSGGFAGQTPASDQSLLTAPAHPDSFYAGARAAVRIAQCFSLIPVKLSPGREP